MLASFNQDGIELHIDTVTGESFTTVRGYSRMSGKAVSTISERFQGVRKEDIKSAESLTNGGVQGVRLLPEYLVSQWIVKDNPELAAKMLQAGVRVFLHTLAGYEVKSNAIQQPEQPKLPPSKVALETARDIAEIQELMINNPRLAQVLTDHAMNTILEQRQLPSGDPALRGAVEIAHEMGFKTDLSSRVKLGNFMREQLPHLAGNKETRLCNGTNRLINCYPDTEEVRMVIASFFS